MKRICFLIPAVLVFSLLLTSCFFWGNTSTRVILSAYGGAFSFWDQKSSLLGENRIFFYGSSSIAICDFSNVLSPYEISQIYNNSGSVSGTVRCGDLFFASGSGSLYYYDFSVPESPVEYPAVDDPGISWQEPAILLDGYLYMSGFSIVDVSSPASPTLTGELPLIALDGIHVSGNYAFLVNPYGLYVMDVADKTSPQVAAKLPGINSCEFRNMAVFGNFIYISNWEGRSVVVIDVSDPVNPVKVNEIVHEFPESYIKSMTSYGNSLYIIVYYPESNVAYPTVYHYDVSSPASPLLMGDQFEALYITGDMLATEDYLYTSSQIMIRPK